MIRFGIIAATVAEAKIITKKNVEPGSISQLNEHGFLTISGMGKKNAYLACEQLYQKKCNLLISWGTAASTHPSLNSGTLVVSGRATTSTGNEYRSARFITDSLQHLLRKNNLVYSDLSIFQVDNILSRHNEKQAIYKKYNARIIDMESAAILSYTQSQNIYGLVIRSICDDADMVLPTSVLHSINEYGQMNFFKFFISLLHNPRDTLHLIALAHAYQKASRCLNKTAPILMDLLSDMATKNTLQ